MGGGVLSDLFRKVLGGAGDDIANKVASQYGDDVVRTLATSSADDIAAKQGNLIATHQLTPEKLSGVADLGGFVQPSMAVVDPRKGTNFCRAVVSATSLWYRTATQLTQHARRPKQ